MAVSTITSNNIPASPPARPVENRQASEKPIQQVTVPSPPPKPAPSVNTNGQTIGTRISTSA